MWPQNADIDKTHYTIHMKPIRSKTLHPVHTRAHTKCTACLYIGTQWTHTLTLSRFELESKRNEQLAGSSVSLLLDLVENSSLVRNYVNGVNYFNKNYSENARNKLHIDDNYAFIWKIPYAKLPSYSNLLIRYTIAPLQL